VGDWKHGVIKIWYRPKRHRDRRGLLRAWGGQGLVSARETQGQAWVTESGVIRVWYRPERLGDRFG
jgi:hypothetical protein